MKNKKITSIFAATLAGVLLTSPFSYVQAEEETGPAAVAPEKPALELEATEEKTTEEKTTTTEEKVVITRWEDETGKELKPKKEGKTSAPAGTITDYEFVETNDTDPEVVIHVFKKKEDKEITTEWEDTEGKELKKPETGKEEKDHGTIEGYKFERTTSKDGKVVTHIFKKEETKTESSDKKDDKPAESTTSKKDDSKPAEGTTTKKDETTKAGETTKKSTDKPETTQTTTKAGETTKKEGTKPVEGPTTEQTTEAPVVTTSTDKDGAQAPIINTETTQESTTKAGSKGTQPEEPKYRSIFINKSTGAHIVDGRAGKEKISIDGYEFINTIEGQEGVFYHYYKPKGSSNNGQTNSKIITTVWQDVYSGKQLLPTKEGKQEAGYISGYTFVKTKSYDSTGTIIHYFKKVNEDKTPKYNHHWSYHVDIDTGELIYYDFYRNGWRYPISINGYAYVDTDSWTDRSGITYHTHYYKRVSRSVAQVDPNKVFTVWVDEYYNQILPSKMGSYEAGELEGYEFDRTISVNDGYGIAHVFKKVDGEERLAGKDTDKSMGYRVRSMLPRTSAAGGTNYLPIGIAGGVGAAIGAGVYYIMRKRKDNQNNNNFPPFTGQ